MFIMQLPPSVIYRLLLGEHIYPEERKQLGITPTTKIKINDLVTFLASEINRTNRFPPEANKDSLSPTHEGVIVTKTSEKRFVCLSKRTLAGNPMVIAEQAETVFRNAQEAATFFLKWALCLPGRLDGIIIE